jgi:Domain of unknown function (DUF4336)
MSELQQFAEGISIVDGAPVRMLGVPLPTRMILVKLADGSLWLNSPVSVAIQVLDRIKASGPVRYLVAPTKMHVWRLEEWHTLFPEAELWIPQDSQNESKRLPFACIPGGLLSLAGRTTLMNSCSKEICSSKKSSSSINGQAP